MREQNSLGFTFRQNSVLVHLNYQHFIYFNLKYVRISYF